MSDQPPVGHLPLTTPAGEDPGTAHIRRLIREELAAFSKRTQSVGWVTGLEPLTVRLKSGGDIIVSGREATLSPAIGDRVSLSYAGDGYVATGMAAGPDDAQTVNHAHAYSDITASPAFAMDVLATYAGDGVATVAAWGNTVDTNALDPDGNLLTVIPQDYDALLLAGKIAHSNDGTSTGLVEARLRFNADTGTNYSYVVWESTGTTFTASNGLGQNRIFVSAGTGGTLWCYLPGYADGDAHLDFEVRNTAHVGTGSINNYSQRLSGGRFAKAGAPVEDIRIFVTGGNVFTDKTLLTLYGLR